MSKKKLADQIDLLTNQPQLQFFLEGVGVEGGFCWVIIFVVVTMGSAKGKKYIFTKSTIN